MAGGNELNDPDDPRDAVSGGRRTDGFAAGALRLHLAHWKFDDLGEYGRGQAERPGYTEADVFRLIDESRREHRANRSDARH
jgi:hypothetical protein